MVRQVPKGRVTTYKKIAEALGTKAYRAVGQALRRNPDPKTIPCHRVVASDGSLGGFFGRKTRQALKEKKRRLEREGVRVKKGRVTELEKIVFTPLQTLLN